MKIFRKLFLLVICATTVLTSCSQESKKPFYKEIQAFKAPDKKNPPPKNAILFVGSSSFAMWKRCAGLIFRGIRSSIVVLADRG